MSNPFFPIAGLTHPSSRIKPLHRDTALLAAR
jgi:hypothetical protein